MAIANARMARWQALPQILLLIFCVSQLTLVSTAHADEPPTSSLEAREEAALKAAADAVAPSVVQIRTIGGFDTVEGVVLADGPTTGVVISTDGYIISSAFNFAQQPASILVTFASGKQVPAELVATDHSRMLVLLKANNVADLSVPIMAPVVEIRPGQWAIAVGRTYRADKINMTVGIVSALGRMFGKAIQTDADVSLANYGGPLVDISGRVMGIIVPMAPQQGASEIAGAEWYDSGIGFAVPIDGLTDRIEQMKKGEDQRPGLLGIGMLSKNPHSSPAELATVRPDAPAGKAGLKKADRIVEINGKPVQTQTDLRFALGTAYGGDEVRVVATRGKERIERTIKLVGELPSFRHAFLGVLPIRSLAKAPSATKQPGEKSDEPKTGNKSEDMEPVAPEVAAANDKETKKGVLVRMVYDGSPAATAGIQPGDRITSINDTSTVSIEDAINTLNSLATGSKIELKIVRDNKASQLTLAAASLPTNVPANLPPAFTIDPASNSSKEDAATGETRDLKLPEFANNCRVYLPATPADQPLAAILWLQGPNDAKPDDVIRDWQPICDRDGILLVIPSPASKDQWERPELEYLRRLSEHIVTQYKIDPHRMVIFGQGKGGTIAWPLALASRDLVRGLATTAMQFPRPLRVPPNEPSMRFSIFSVLPAGKDLAAPVSAGLKKFSDAGYNVEMITAAGTSGQLSEAERNQLARWIDTLDRF